MGEAGAEPPASGAALGLLKNMNGGSSPGRRWWLACAHSRSPPSRLRSPAAPPHPQRPPLGRPGLAWPRTSAQRSLPARRTKWRRVPGPQRRRGGRSRPRPAPRRAPPRRGPARERAPPSLPRPRPRPPQRRSLQPPGAVWGRRPLLPARPPACSPPHRPPRSPQVGAGPRVSPPPRPLLRAPGGGGRARWRRGRRGSGAAAGAGRVRPRRRGGVPRPAVCGPRLRGRAPAGCGSPALRGRGRAAAQSPARLAVPCAPGGRGSRAVPPRPAGGGRALGRGAGLGRAPCLAAHARRGTVEARPPQCAQAVAAEVAGRGRRSPAAPLSLQPAPGLLRRSRAPPAAPQRGLRNYGLPSAPAALPRGESGDAA